MYLWLIPMIYVGASVVCGLGLPRIEQAYLRAPSLNLSVASTQAYLSTAANGTQVRGPLSLQAIKASDG
jgi:hypothetical protein